jgi:hypothetical protein
MRRLQLHSRILAVALLTAAVIVVPTRTQAQTLTGIVTDSAGRPLREAELLVGQGPSRTRADSMGRYSIRLPHGGRVQVMVRLVGYRQFIDTVQVPGFGTQRFNIRLQKLPTRLATVTVTDRSLCETTSLSSFECRRNSGVGHFRDAGELRAMRPRNWADMLDGMPGLRREPRRGPYGMDWRPTAPPSRCVREIWNGQLPMEAPGAEFQPDEMWTPNDVVAIEYYESHNEVPPQYKRYAWWPPLLGQPCGLIVYWLRGADRGKRPPPEPG